MDVINIDENQQLEPSVKDAQPNQDPQPKSEGRIKRLLRWMKNHKVKTALIALALLAGLAVASYYYWKNHQPVGQFDNYKGKAKTTAPSPLTGLEVPKDVAKRPVTGVMIENSPDARPQSGLQDAGIVFEAVAEGGITRFLALYQEARPQLLGPIRSLRIYYLNWVMGFDAPAAHVGGNEDALVSVRQRGAKDLDQFRYGSYFWRASDRFAPHNVYTSFDKLDELNAKVGYTSSKFNPYPRKKDSPVNPPTATQITLDYSGPLYTVVYNYDATADLYLRSLAGQPHIDRESKQQIKVKNIVVMMIPAKYHSGYVEMQSLGNGQAIVFRDGTAIAGTWEKSEPKSPLLIKDAQGKEIPLNKGNTWFSVVPTGRPVTY